MNARFCSQGRVLPYIFYLILSYWLLCCWRPVAAQSLPGLKTLQIGDTVPDVMINQILHYKTPTAKLSDFKGKLLILDFWATWCQPCVYMIPRMDSLQKRFEGKVQFLAVSSEPQNKIDTFRAKYDKRFGRRIQHPEVVSDSVLRSLFPHNALPHYVWVDQDGVVVAITDLDAITADKIGSFLKAETLVLSEKKDASHIAYKKELPLLANGNGGDGTNIVYHSLFTGYTPDLEGVYNWSSDPKKGRKITVTNCSRYWLYRIAYARAGGLLDEGSIMIESAHADKLTTRLYGQKYEQWLSDNNGFCYELIVPASFQQKTNVIMQQDLDNFFPEFSASMEKRSGKALVLMSAGNGKRPAAAEAQTGRSIYLDPFGWKLTNTSLAGLVARFNQTQNHPVAMVDQTGISGGVNLEIEGSVADLAGLNKTLALHGLKLVETQLERQVLVIRDRELAGK
jgi:thiol-disulfide isomerase/thioredoxin